MKIIVEILEKIASDIIIVETDDLTSLSNIHTQFEELKTLFTNKKWIHSSKICEESSKEIESILLQDSKDDLQSIEIVKNNISLLQRTIQLNDDNSAKTKNQTKITKKSKKVSTKKENKKRKKKPFLP